jgi:hypothetical protein
MNTRALLRTITWTSLLSLGVVGAAGCAPDAGDPDAEAIASIVQEPDALVCSGGRLRCKAHVRVDRTTGFIKPFAAPSGFGAPDLVSAYKLDTSVNPGATIAIVDAYGYPAAESDLAKYRTQFGLPACTVANGCLRIINQRGATSPLPPKPPAGDDWTVETALDLDMASAACPSCKLLLVQADDDQGDGLFIAQNAAANAGATVISNSWGDTEPSNVATYESTYFQTAAANASIFVSSGDSGYTGAQSDYPSTSLYVTAVGGTRLVRSSNSRGWTESAWSGAGSSCSIAIAKPGFQNVTTGCSKRAASDVSAVADSSTGVAVYNAASGGWLVVGGTSASSPFVAGVYALTGHGKAGPAFAYQSASSFFDVTSGSNGSCGAPLCTSRAGWDGPTGVGTPNGALLAGGTTPTNDFSISASPASRSIAAGGSTTFTVATAVTAGSAQTVSLSASGLPSGASASFSPASVTAGGSSTLSITTTAATAGGTYTVTITGAGSAATHATTVSLTITGGTSGGPTISSVALGRTSAPTSGNNSIVVVVSDTVSITDVVLNWPYNGKVIKASAPNATAGWTVTHSGNTYTFTATFGTGARSWTVTATDSAGKSASKSGSFTFN